MNEQLIFFTEAEGLLLIKLLLAQFISDFLFQTDKMVKNKRWFSAAMALHIAIVYATSALLTGLWIWSVLIAFMHWMIDATKIELEKRKIFSSLILFVSDQLLHIAVVVFTWANYCNAVQALAQSITLPLLNYKIGLILLGYVIILWPVGYLIGFATQNIAKRVNRPDGLKDEKVEHGGKLIGLFERAIILTFVLLNQYEAIGFLITGKSIIRFAQKEENLRSEYVLVGTMMSYAFSIIAGVFINWLLTIAG